MKLRPYQLQLCRDIRSARLALLERGVACPRVLAVLPTGGGKTVVFAAIASAAVASVGPGLIVAHREELVLQAADKLRALGLRVGVIMAGHAADPGAPVQVCSAQTVRARAYAPDGIRWVIIDEAHHATAALWSSLVGAYGGALAFVLGFTATPARADGVALSCAFDAIVQGPTVAEMVALRALVPVRTLRPVDEQRELFRDPLALLLEHRAAPSVTFCDSVEASRSLAEQANAAGLRILHVDGNTRGRDKLLARLGTDFDGVTNADLLTEGWDWPAAALCILAARCGSVASLLQRSGRVMRLWPGKVEAVFYDLCGVTHTLGTPDDDRLWSLGADSGKVRPGSVAKSTCPKCHAVYRVAPRCPRCGAVAPPPPRIRVKWAAMEEAQRSAISARIEPVAWLASKMAEAERRGLEHGRNNGSVFHKFKAVMSRRPTSAEVSAAKALLDGVEAEQKGAA